MLIISKINIVKIITKTQLPAQIIIRNFRITHSPIHLFSLSPSRPISPSPHLPITPSPYLPIAKSPRRPITLSPHSPFRSLASRQAAKPQSRYHPLFKFTILPISSSPNSQFIARKNLWILKYLHLYLHPTNSIYTIL